MYKLRDYQQKASDAAVEFFCSNAKKNSIIVLPTGSGKSLVIADIASRLDAPTLIFQPSKEILEQNYMKLQSYGIWDCSVYSASFNQKEIRRITFATIGSVRKSSELFKAFKYIIIDECHLVNPKEGMYEQFLAQLGDSKVLGLTATPYRLHSSMGWGAMLKFITRTRPRIFDDVLYSVQISTLADMGYLAKLQYYQMSLIDQRRLKSNSTGADFSDKSILSEYKRINFYQLLCDIIQRLLNAQRTGILVFTKFIKEAERLSRTFDCCAIVSGSTPKSERERILSAFKRGEIKVVANVGVLTTGFDYPELDTVVLARPTISCQGRLGVVSTEFLSRYNGGQPEYKSLSLDEPCGTVTTENRFAKVGVHFLSKQFSGHPDSKNVSVEAPAGTITCVDHHAFVSAYYGNGNNHDVNNPCPTITCKDRFSLISSHFLDMQYGNGTAVSVDAPAGTVTTSPKHNLVSIKPWVMKTNFNKLRDQAHENAVAKGFWNTPAPSTEHFLMLIITELSEVVEADRKNRVLDKNKELEFQNYDSLYKGSKEWTNYGYINLYERYIKGSIQEEVADVVIRILDLAGGLGIDVSKVPQSLIELHKERIQSYTITQSMFFYCQNVCLLGREVDKEVLFRSLIAEMIAFCEINEIDLIWHIEAKMRYNKTRSTLHNKKY